MESAEKHLPSELLKRGYSNQEIGSIYELARLFMEGGDFRRAELILLGLREVSPDFAPARLALALVHYSKNEFELGIECVKQALKFIPGMPEAVLILAAGLMQLKEFNSAGTYLGELGERIEAGQIEEPKILRIYKALLLRYR